MPNLRSLAGLVLFLKYVKNWYSPLAVYFHIISRATATFKDGSETIVSKDDHSAFYEEIYKRYLEGKGFSYRENEERVIQIPNGLQVMFLKPPYSFILDEIFVMKVYGQPNLQGRSVIDIGAYLGESALYFASLGASKVFGFEPDIQNYKMAQKNVEINKMTDKIHIYNQKATGESLRTLILENGFENVFVKIDCEGCEYELIENTDDQTFQSITDVVMEYHREPEPLMSRLRARGFNLRRKKGYIFATKP